MKNHTYVQNCPQGEEKRVKCPQAVPDTKKFGPICAIFGRDRIKLDVNCTKTGSNPRNRRPII
ncbi:hypothetical protein ACQKP0_08935 [Heyndrickxia sp. NPDC080065]|uniref:hypothetical protein n=1 Tax=Heyndrickxia sp. NPDC080065 TaxID=3390568 RepID=UPI003D01B756